MIAEWVQVTQKEIDFYLDYGPDKSPICCLCLQETPMETTWNVKAPNGIGYLCCSDCRTAYAGEPEVAYIVAMDWVKMLHSLIPLGGDA